MRGRILTQSTGETYMTAGDVLGLAPLISTSCCAVLVLAALALHRGHGLTVLLTLLGLAVSLVSIVNLYGVVPLRIAPLFMIDGAALFYMALICCSGMAVTALSYGYLKERSPEPGEYYLLLLLAVVGAMVLAAAGHFVAFFLGLEILSVSLYALTGYTRLRERSVEAAMKYLILAAVSASFLLFGMALVYARFGAMEFGEIVVRFGQSSTDYLSLSGSVLIIIGVGFKLGLVPFHMWTPDVYEGAPAPVTAFIATVSKGAVFALLIRYFGPLIPEQKGALFLVFSLLSAVSMFTGNLLALLQDNVKRILAYSSISHMGYLMIAFLAGTGQSASAGFYLAAYFITTLGVFGVITVLSGRKRDADRMEDLEGLAWRSPWLAAILSAMLLSLAGIPLTAGFIGKFYVAKAGAGASLWLLITALAVNSVIGLFYYLRIVAVLFSAVPAGASSPAVSWHDRLVIGVLVVGLLWMGVYPGPFARFIEIAMAVVI